MASPKEEVLAELDAVLAGLKESATLTPTERVNVAKWGAALAQAALTGDEAQAKNYATSLDTMLGVAILRAANAGEKALLRIGNIAINALLKVALAAA